ncbi:MAG TPA: sulfotransferase [Candidatus Thermoplasmatota archaeon]|nr:sulfotransferase [Candidatus Thermoplasmatota archaeon]
MKARFEKKQYLVINTQPLAGSTFVTWMKVLLENRFQIDWQFIPKALYVTIMILATTPLRFIEKWKFEKKFKDVKIEKPIFIIGHWRSGTTFLHYLMGNDKNLGYVSTMDTLDPSVFLNYEKLLHNIVQNSLPEKRPMDNLEMGTKLPYEEEYAIANLSPYSFYHAWYFPRAINRYFTRYVLYEGVDRKIVEQWKKTYLYFLKKITYKHQGKQIVIKSLVNTAKIQHLLELFPDAKFIHQYRNPYEVYMSTWRLYNSILPLFSFQHIDKEEFDTSILTIYRRISERYLQEKKLIPKENLIELRYEDFVKDPLQTLEMIYKKFNLPGFEEVKPAFEKYLKKHEVYERNHYSIDEQTKKKVYQAWEVIFKEFGYRQ